MISRNKNVKKSLPVKNSSAEIAFGELGELLGYRLRRAQIAMHRDFISSIAGLDLTQKQTAILWLVSNNPGASQASVAGALGMDRPSMMAITDRLQERGFITRARSTVDRRRQELHLTRAGESMLTKVKERIEKHEQRIRALFNTGELEALLGSLQKFQGTGMSTGGTEVAQSPRAVRAKTAKNPAQPRG